MKFQMWDSELDIIVFDAKPLLPENHPVVMDNSPWAYALNTEKGFFHKSKHKASLENDDLLLTTELGTEVLFANVTIWPQHYYKNMMIVTLHETKQTIIIDSRGIPFEINCSYSDYCYGKKVFESTADGYYLVDNSFVIKYRSNEEQSKYEEKSSAISGAIFNKAFNKFIRANSDNDLPYLYLTGGNTKCGILFDYFVSQGMEYEIIPNMLCDDESINIRIPLYGNNILREDVQYLCAKYDNTYAVYNVPITVAGALFTPASKMRTYVPKNKECLARSIFNTFCEVFNTRDTGKIFQRTTAKIIRLFNKFSVPNIPNTFNEMKLLHPNDIEFNDSYFNLHKSLIAQMLSVDISIIDLELYRKAYELSKQLYKDRMQRYESETLNNVLSQGKQISRWKNESHLFELVKKVYPDSIYQYHVSWLGLQSIDIYIPSLSIGIEYQGEQHFRPIDYFGGDKAFEEVVKRDKRKAKLCADNKVSLIYWGFDEVISVNHLKEKINSIIK